MQTERIRGSGAFFLLEWHPWKTKVGRQRSILARDPKIQRLSSQGRAYVDLGCALKSRLALLLTNISHTIILKCACI